MERPVVSLRTVIIAVGAAQFMLPFMLSGAGPLLPAIGRDLHASAMQLSLINAAYTLSLAIFHLVAGRVGDMVGRKRLFLSGLSLFVVMSALLPFVTNIWLFLCCRFVQAMGTAIMNTCALAILVSARRRNSSAGCSGSLHRRVQRPVARPRPVRASRQ
ncbi:MAG: MFS transporter [Bilophila wadsworthia]